MSHLSSSTPQLKSIVNFYSKYLPTSTYPWVMLTLASCCVFFSWFGGQYLFPNATLVPRMFYSWIFTAIEYSFLLPGIGASVEVLGMSQNTLAIILHAIQITVYLVLNKLTTNFEITKKHLIAFPLMVLSVIIAAF